MILSYDELVTLLARISCSMNSRPLALANTSYTDQQEDILLPITPNHMLLGRSSPESPPLEFCQRLAYVDAVEQELWSRWIKTVLPTMLPVQRWKREEKNLIVGDVVLLTFPGNVKDDYILARVPQVHTEEKNLVRRVSVKYKRKNAREARSVQVKDGGEDCGCSEACVTGTSSQFLCLCQCSFMFINSCQFSYCSFLFITTFQFLLCSFTMILK